MYMNETRYQIRGNSTVPKEFEVMFRFKYSDAQSSVYCLI